MTWRRDEQSRADRLDRAMREPLHLFDDETQELVRTARSLRPAFSPSESRRAATKAAFLASFEAADEVTPAPALVDDAVDVNATSLLHPVFGRVIASDVEPIGAERAQEIAERLERLVGESAYLPPHQR